MRILGNRDEGSQSAFGQVRRRRGPERPSGGVEFRRTKPNGFASKVVGIKSSVKVRATKEANFV
jgi:hypothetical protein